MGLAAALIVVLVVAVLALGYVQITGLTIGDKSFQTFDLTEDEDPDTPERDISMDIVQGDFDPRHIVVKEGETVNIHLTGVSIADGFETHGFAIKEFGVDETVDIGETKTVTFVPDQAGTFSFFCSVFCGQGHTGQVGTLTVV